MAQAAPSRNGFMRRHFSLDSHARGSCRVLLLLAIFVSGNLEAQSAKSLFTSQRATTPAEKTATPTPTPSATPFKAIPLPQIANEAEKLDGLLLEVSQSLMSVPDLSLTDAKGKSRAEEVQQRAQQVQDLLSGIPNVMQFQDEARYWKGLAEEYASRRRSLTERAAAVENQIGVLDAENSRWTATLEQVRGTPGLDLVANSVQREVDAIQKLRSEAQHQLNQILTLQNQIAEQDREIVGVLQQLNEARERLRGRLLERDSRPLWTRRQTPVSGESVSTAIYSSGRRAFTGTTRFARASGLQLVATGVIYLIALLIAFRCRRQARRAETTVSPDVQRLFGRPFSVALLASLLTTVGIMNTGPTGVSFVICLVYIVPVLRLLPALIAPEMRKLLFAISIFYFLQWAYLILQFGAVFKREFIVAIIFAAILVFTWLARPSLLTLQPSSSWSRTLFIIGIRIGIAVLALSLVANIVGFVSLSQILGSATLFSAFTFAWLYAVVKLFEGAIAVAVSSKWFQSLPETRAEAVDRFGKKLLILCASLIWVNVNLYLFTVRDIVLRAVKEVLQYPIGFGKVHVTLDGILTLCLFLLLGYVIANIAKFIMEEVLLPPLSLRGGLAFAISRVTYYVLLTTMFFAALTNAGVELNKFTVITGAIGLGVGFGLQNIVSNFASGLIILFERPFRVGDTVEAAGVAGTVRRIGARSTTVLTSQYAEAIVPNSNLLANEVINWTLTSARRRVEVPVGVAYGTDPQLALRLLIEVAEANPRILKEPRPEAFFLGFGDSALNLELRFWAAQSIWFELKSEIGLAIFQALHRAGIDIPFPQREVHVHAIETTKEKQDALSTPLAKKIVLGK